MELQEGGGCGVEISGIDRRKWFTVCKVASPLVECFAMQAEIRGCDLLISEWWIFFLLLVYCAMKVSRES